MTRALLVSFLLHAAAISLALYLHAGPGTEVKHPGGEDFVVEAPLGHVFVTEAPSGEETKAQKSEEARREESSAENPLALPEAVKKVSEGDAGESGPAGTPEGEAQPLGKIEPEYPPVSRRLGEEGEAVFQLSIRPDGSVAAAELEKSSGFGRLDSSARAALLSATFQPARHGGQATSSRKRFRVEFRLEKRAPNP